MFFTLSQLKKKIVKRKICYQLTRAMAYRKNVSLRFRSEHINKTQTHQKGTTKTSVCFTRKHWKKKQKTQTLHSIRLILRLNSLSIKPNTKIQILLLRKTSHLNEPQTRQKDTIRTPVCFTRKHSPRERPKLYASFDLYSNKATKIHVLINGKIFSPNNIKEIETFSTSRNNFQCKRKEQTESKLWKKKN